MRLRSFAAAAALLAASVTSAAPPEEQTGSERVSAEESTAEAPVQAEAEPERKVCRTERATGSLTRRTRVCMTAAQWRELHDRTRRGVDELVGGAQAEDLQLTGEGGLLQRLTKRLLKSALEGEITDHLGHDKQCCAPHASRSPCR